MDKKVLVIASGNRHKVEEIRRIMNLPEWEIKGTSDLGVIKLPEEIGDTYEDNALIKAKACAEKLGLISLADDSGLEVEILNGAPGVISSRYGGVEGDSARNIEKLLRELEGVPWHLRRARFVCCALLYCPEGRIHLEWGIVNGYITFAPVGDRGFGYDPIFIPDGYNKTFAELDPEEKDKISHRGIAFRKMAEFLRSV